MQFRKPDIDRKVDTDRRVGREQPNVRSVSSLAADPYQNLRILLVAGLTAVVLWLIGALGWLDTFRGPLEDIGTQLRARAISERESVLLIPELRSTAAAQEEVLNIAEQLRSKGALGLALSSWPAEWPATFSTSLEREFPGVVFGLRPQIDGINAERLRAPDSASTLIGTRAWSTSPALHGDLAGRRQQARLALGDVELDSLAWSLAPDERSLDAGSFGIVYRGGPGSLPLLSVERSASGELIRDLVENRYVVLDPSPATLGQRTPTTRPEQLMSVLEIQGHALDTLVHGRRLRRPAGWIELTLLILVAVILAALAQRLGVRWLFWLAITAIAVGVLGGLALHLLTGLLMPGAELALLGTIVAAAAARRRLTSSQEAARSLLRDSMGRLQSRVWPSSFYLSEDPWPHLADLVDQTFDLRRLIFLEIVPGDHRVREIHAVGCGLDDIHERRRDYLRSPYSNAIRKNAPFRLDRTYLRESTDDEVQYLVPLTFGGDVLGFWAFGAKEETTHAPDFDLLLHNFADQLAEILHHRARTKRSMGSVAPVQGRFLWEKQDETFRALHWLSILLERRLTRTESLLQGLGTAVVVYDLFGRAMDVTHQMGEILRHRELNPNELTSLQLISELTGAELQEVRANLRKVLLGGESLTLEVQHGEDDLHLVMMLTPIRPKTRSSLDEGGAFGIIGVAIELVDTTAQEALSKVQSNLSERLSVRLRNDLSAVDFALQLLDDKAMGETYTDEMLAVASLKTTQMQKVLDECEDYLAIDLRKLRDAHYPIDAQPHLHRALDQRRSQAEARRIQLQVQVPRLMNHVLASPLAFERGLHTLLDYLLEDARDGGLIELRVEENESRTDLLLNSQGYGTPQRSLDSILAGADNLEKATHRALGRLAGVVDGWGGSLTGTSQVGEGTQFTLSLERLHYL